MTNLDQRKAVATAAGWTALQLQREPSDAAVVICAGWGTLSPAALLLTCEHAWTPLTADTLWRPCGVQPDEL